MPNDALPTSVIQRVLEFLSPQDVAFCTIIPPFSSALQLSRACKTMLAHPEYVARSVVEISIVHSMQDIDKTPTLYYTIRAALAMCTMLETLYLHTDPAVMRTILGECTFRLRTLSLIDCHQDLPTVFLSRQESLEELIIVRGNTTPLYLPKNVLPNLSSFSGIPENAIRISRGRRLHTLRLLPGPNPLNLGGTLFRLDSLVLSSLNEFHVLVTGSVLHHVTTISQFLPRLTTLVIRYYQQIISFGDFASAVSVFVNLREFSMLSLNMQQPLTPIALDSEYSIVTLYHEQCPTLQVVVLRCMCWVRRSEGDSSKWTPLADNHEILDMWQNHCEKKRMGTKEADGVLRGPNDDTDEYSSGDYVTMDLDGKSEGSDISYGEEPRPLQVYSDEMRDTKPLVIVEKDEGERQNLVSLTSEGLIDDDTSFS